MDKNNTRLITFILVCVGILFFWQKFVLEPYQKDFQKAQKAWRLKQKKTKASSKAKQRPGKVRTSGKAGVVAKSNATSRPTTRPGVRAAATRPAPKKVTIARVKTQTAGFKNKLVSLKLSNQGGGLTEATLSSFFKKGTLRKKKPTPLDLLKKKGKAETFVERFLDANLAQHASVSYRTLKSTKGGAEVTLTAQIPSKRGGYLEVQKVYQFRKDSYKFNVAYKLINKTGHIVSSRMKLLLRDREDPKKITGGGFMSQPTIFEVICRKAQENKPERVSLDAMKKKKQVSGNIAYVGINRQYFLMGVVPSWPKKDTSTDCSFQNKKGAVTLALHNRGENIPAGGAVKFGYVGYLGPKYYKRLREVGNQLDSAIDFGIFAFFSRPMLWLLQFFYNMMGGLGNWGFAIILLTFLAKLVVLPLTNKSMDSMIKMQQLKPEMDRLKEKYGDDKESFQRETMALYAKYGINPLGGCLPMLFQLPIWLALYNMLFSAVELYQKPFIAGWIDDLSSRDPYYVMPVLMGVSMFLQQRLTPQTGMDETQAKIMAVMMPIMFTGLMFFLPAGLTLYIFVNTIVGVVHHVYIHKNAKPLEVVSGQKKQGGFMAKMQQMVEEAEKAKKGR